MSKPTGDHLPMERWCFISPVGRLVTGDEFESPEIAWWHGLGWPDPAEIGEAERQGSRVVKAIIMDAEAAKRMTEQITRLRTALQKITDEAYANSELAGDIARKALEQLDAQDAR